MLKDNYSEIYQEIVLRYNKKLQFAITNSKKITTVLKYKSYL